MREKIRLFPPAAFNQTKIGEQLSSLRHSQQSVGTFAALNRARASDSRRLTEIPEVF